MALGASVLRYVLWEGTAMCVVGLVVGLMMSLGVRQVIGSILVGVGSVDYATLALTSVLLLAATIGASLLPAMRAARVSPVEALRGTAT